MIDPVGANLTRGDLFFRMFTVIIFPIGLALLAII